MAMSDLNAWRFTRRGLPKHKHEDSDGEEKAAAAIVVEGMLYGQERVAWHAAHQQTYYAQSSIMRYVRYSMI